MFASSFTLSFREGERPAAVTTSNVNTIPGIAIWYDAATPAFFQPTLPSNGALISQWNDKSGGAHNASPKTGGTKPTFVSTATTVAGVPVGAVNFDGTQNLEIQNTTWLQNLTGYTFFMVARTANTSSVRTLSLSDTGGFGNIMTNGVWSVQAVTATGTNTVSSLNTTSFHVHTLLFNGSGVGNDGRAQFRYDKSPQTLTWTGTVGTATNAATKLLGFAYNTILNSNFYQGQIAEVLLYSRTLNSTEVTGVESYLSSKWGTP